MEKVNLPKWIIDELKIRDWSQADLSRKTGISTAQINRILKGERGFGVEALVSISNAFEISPITVLRQAGLLPQGPDDKINFDDWQHLLNQMTEAERDEIWRIGLMKVEIRQEKEKAARAGGFKIDKVKK